MINKFKKLTRLYQTMIIATIVLTFIRVFIALKMPLFIQAGAGFDDYLLFEYAKYLVRGDWLGPFGTRTLAKGISFPIFVALSYLLCIPYSLALILLYIFGIIIFLSALRPYIKRISFYFFSYIFLLYSPVMFHIENVQKVYRGGLIVCMSLITLGTMIHLFNHFKDKSLKKLIKYSIIGCISLPFFYYIKEDSIWILPFVCASIGFSLMLLFFDKNIKKRIIRSVLLVLPIISLIIVNVCYCTMNYIKYGEYTITDRGGTYFKEMMADIIRIDEPNEVEEVWITKNMMYTAIEHSKTLQTVKPQIDEMYAHSWAVHSNGEIFQDIIYWTFKEAMGEAGIYDKGGKYVNNFYKKVDQELDEAVEKGELKLSKKKKIYISSISIGYTMDEIIDYYSKNTIPAINMMITYSENTTTLNHATGPMYGIIAMDTFTNSETVWPEEYAPLTEPHEIMVNVCNAIVSIYKSTGYIFFFTGLIGLVLLTVTMIQSVRKKSFEQFYLWLITLGLIGTCCVLMFGVLWFSSCFGNSILRHTYNYSCGIVPVIQILEMIGIYYVVSYFLKYVLKKERVK